MRAQRSSSIETTQVPRQQVNPRHGTTVRHDNLHPHVWICKFQASHVSMILQPYCGEQQRNRQPTLSRMLEHISSRLQMTRSKTTVLLAFSRQRCMCTLRPVVTLIAISAQAHSPPTLRHYRHNCSISRSRLVASLNFLKWNLCTFKVLNID